MTNATRTLRTPLVNDLGRLTCVSDRYDRSGGRYTSVADFLAMCSAVFGEAPDLVERADGWHDEHGLVLRAE